MAERLVRRVLYPVSRALRDEGATEPRRDPDTARSKDASVRV